MNQGPKRLRELLARPGVLLSLGAHDVFTALLVEQEGFESVFIGGFGASASLLGLPDLNFLSMAEMASLIQRTSARVSIPVIADGDTGHGDLHNVEHTVRMFEAAGASGILIEDQVLPKRCGHFERKQVIPAADMVRKIKTAVRARSHPDFVIIARSDARQVNGLEDAVARVNRCCEAGADVAFVEAPESRRELEEIPRRVPYPLLANVLTGGVTPILSARELEELGYKIVVCPVESLIVTAAAVRRLAQMLLREGRVDRLAEQEGGFSELKRILGLERYLKLADEIDGEEAEPAPPR